MLGTELRDAILTLRVSALCRLAGKIGLKPDLATVTRLAETLSDRDAMAEIRRLFYRRFLFFRWFRYRPGK